MLLEKEYFERQKLYKLERMIPKVINKGVNVFLLKYNQRL